MIPFDDVQPGDRPRIGPKAHTLALLKQAGFNVPNGFIVLSDSPLSLDETLLSHGEYAVRSSASDEDGSSSSMAGQYRTHLRVHGLESVLKAIADCRAYHPPHLGKPANMAVIVQEMVTAEVAGVMFTANPLDPSDNTLTVEAAHGLGDNVVSGKVTPDRFTVSDNGIVSRVAESMTLPDERIQELAVLGHRVADHLRAPQDIEWAIADGTIYLLQARPITTKPRLRAIACEQETIWITDALSEAVNHPTPMTWSILERLLAADGGMGAMARAIGVGPHPNLGSQTCYDLIAGRPRLNLRRAARMRYGKLALDYHTDDKLSLDSEQYIKLVCTSWYQLPWIVWKLIQAKRRQKQSFQSLINSFSTETLPRFCNEVETVTATQIENLNNEDLLALLHQWINKTCIEFGKHYLLIANRLEDASQALHQLLAVTLDPEQLVGAMTELLRGTTIPTEIDLAAALTSLSRGELDVVAFQQRFGHRGPEEMELAQPRWSELGKELSALIRIDTDGERHTTDKSSINDIIQRYVASSTSRRMQRQIEKQATKVLESISLREVAKDTFMLGFALIRRCLLELDRRYNLQNGIFELTIIELSQLDLQFDWLKKINDRRARRIAETQLSIPATKLDDSDACEFRGIAISLGSGSGPALVRHSPLGVPPPGPYVLVCPSTDPAWTPWFLNAVGIVIERGGVLSHGAIVARELGIPTIGNVENATRMIVNGQRLQVDADAGTVGVLSQTEPG